MAGSESSGIAKPISERSLCAPFVPVPNALAPSSQSVLPLQSSPHTIEPPFADQQHADDYTVPLPPKENQPSLRTQKLAMDDLQEDSSNVATLISNSAAPPARPPTADSTTVNHSATKISSPSAEDPSIPSLNVRNNASSGSPDSEAAMIEKKSRVISTIRSKGLRSYSDIFSAKPFTSAGVEQPKIAIKAGFRVNWFRIFPHIAAVTITAGVVQLSFRNAYWMDLQPPNKLISPGLTQGGALNFLQLAAKLHELLVLTSISSIVLHVVQLDLTGNAGLPLGMIANAFELGSAQFLRRRSFWSALWLRDPATQKRFPSGKFWLLCLFSTILVLLSGPSSAIAIIPSLNFFDLDRPFNQSVSPYYIWNHSMELWPEHITAKSLPSQLPNDPTNITHVMINCSDTSTTSFVTNCPSGGKKDIDTWSANLLLKNSDQGTNFTSLDFNGDNGRIVSVKSCVDSFSGHASGTSINTFISRALTIYWRFARDNFHGSALAALRPYITMDQGTDVFAPRVEVICNTSDNISEDPEIQEAMIFPTLEDTDPIFVPAWAYRYSHPLNITNFTFVELSRSNSLTPSLGAVLALPQVQDDIVDGTWVGFYQKSVNVACSIYSQWTPVDIWFEPTLSDEVSYAPSPGLSGSCLPASEARARRAPINTTIDFAFAQAMNPYFSGKFGGGEPYFMPYLTAIFQAHTSNSTYVEGGVTTDVPLLSSSMLTPKGFNQSEFPSWAVLSKEDINKAMAKFTSTLLAGIITDSLARIAGNGQYPDSSPMFLLPNRTRDGFLQGRFPVTSITGGIKRPLFTTNAEDEAQWLRINPSIKRYGYGYHWHDSPTTQFGITVLLVHTTAAVTYLIYLLYFFIRHPHGGVPGAWETIPELLALAINSKRSTQLNNTCAGIKQSNTWGQRLAVREAEGEHLEVVVGKEEMESLPQVRVGVAYG